MKKPGIELDVLYIPEKKTWIPKMMGLGKGDSGLKYGHFRYQFVRFLGCIRSGMFWERMIRGVNYRRGYPHIRIKEMNAFFLSFLHV